MGKAPSFYKTEVDTPLDFVDEAAIGIGWQRGFNEFVAENSNKNSKAPQI